MDRQAEIPLVIPRSMWNDFAEQIDESRSGQNVESGGYFYGLMEQADSRWICNTSYFRIYRDSDYLSRTREQFTVSWEAIDRMLHPASWGMLPVTVHTHPEGELLGFSWLDRTSQLYELKRLKQITSTVQLGAGVVEHTFNPAQSRFVLLGENGREVPMSLCIQEDGEHEEEEDWEEGQEDNDPGDVTVYRPDPDRVGGYRPAVEVKPDPLDELAEKLLRHAIRRIFRP